MLMFGMYGGLLADRYPKRVLLLCTQVASAVFAAAMGVLDVTGVVQAWHVYVLAFLLGAVAAVDTPTRQAFVVELVGPKDLPNAVGLNSANFNSARILGATVSCCAASRWLARRGRRVRVSGTSAPAPSCSCRSSWSRSSACSD
jgi:MFS family permease